MPKYNITQNIGLLQHFSLSRRIKELFPSVFEFEMKDVVFPWSNGFFIILEMIS